MSEKMIKWGFIGCGEVTKTKSGPAFQKVEHSEVVAVMSRDGAKAKAYAKERGIRKWYDDAQELIDDPEVNAIYIATPPSSHATYAIMAMKAGKPAYIENQWLSLMRSVHVSTVFLRKRVFPVSSHITAAISPTSESERNGRERFYR